MPATVQFDLDLEGRDAIHLLEPFQHSHGSIDEEAVEAGSSALYGLPSMAKGSALSVEVPRCKGS